MGWENNTNIMFQIYLRQLDNFLLITKILAFGVNWGKLGLWIPLKFEMKVVAYSLNFEKKIKHIFKTPKSYITFL